MHKSFKRAVALLLVILIASGAVLTASGAPPLTESPVAAPARQASNEASMETALIAVKSILDIDDDVFSEFSYSSSFSNHETREGLVWYFYWSAEIGYIYAVAADDGTLLGYNKYLFEGPYFGFAELGKTQATTIAGDFLRKASPQTSRFYGEPESVTTNLHSGEFSLVYNARVNGRAFPAAQITIGINKFSGEVTSYSTRNIDPSGFNFDSAASLITQSAAVNHYAEKIGLTLEYRSSFDFEKRELTVFPAYLFNSSGDRFISARTGDVVEYVYDRGMGADGRYGAASPESSMDAMAGGGGSAFNLTPAERAAIEQVAGFLTSEQALQKLLEAAQLTDLNVRSFAEQHISLNRDFYDNNRFFYNINMYRNLDWGAADDEISGLFGRVDAATGRVVSFNFYYHGMPTSSGAAMTEAQVDAAVDSFLRRMAPTELNRVKLEDRQPPMTDRFGSWNSNYNFSYVRHENDIPFRDNSIQVTFNQHTRKVTGYSLNWFDNVTFPSVRNALSPQQALAAYVDQNGSEILYITAGEGNARIVYDFGRFALIDPFTGRAIDHSGTPGSETVVVPEYTDVAGHWSGSYVTKLLDNGIFLWGGRFEPDRVMTELEFLQYIMLIEPQWVARMDPQAFFAQRGVSVEASAEKRVTRQEAARIIVEYMGYGQLARQAQWFVYPFSDGVANEFKGFVTICYMLGIVGGDENGRFNAGTNVTRGQAAVMLHNLILAKSE